MASATGLSANELAAVLEQLPSGVVVVDREGHPLLTNHAARQMLGPGAGRAASLMELAVAGGLRDARTGQLVPREATPSARALRGNVVLNDEYTLAAMREGEPVRVRISSTPLRDHTGTISGAASVITDITAQAAQVRRTEQELAERRRAEEALQRSQQRLHLALEASHMGTWDYDAVSDAMEWSPELTALVGRDPESLGGRLIDALAVIHPADRTAVLSAFRKALENSLSLQVETRLKRAPDERVRWLLIKGRVFRDENGRPLRMTGVAIDVSDRKEAEAARHSLAQGERLRALGEMASGIAHDLNQSLALITGYSDMVRQELNQGVPEVGRVREMIDITARAALEGGKALRGLLSFVRTRDLMHEIERLDMAEVVDDVARLTAPRWRDAPQIEGRPIQLEVHADMDCWMNGSPAELREAITNLIFNAVDALPEGGRIDLTARRQGEHVYVEVCDTGTGMPPHVQARVFDPFFTTKGEHGTGLGLPKVLAIVERHGGNIQLESQPGRGTTFRMKFPRASARPARATESVEKPPPPAERSIRILVVEDEEQLARMARTVLTQRGHEVVVASSGDEALERLEEGRFELVISDLGLGAGKNGWDLAHAVGERWPHTRFILVTGWGAAIDPVEARERGVHEVIAKPYRIADLRQIADSVAAGPGSTL